MINGTTAQIYGAGITPKEITATAKSRQKLQRNTMDAISKITTKILEDFRRKEKTVAIFFDIEKAYDKINRKYL